MDGTLQKMQLNHMEVFIGMNLDILGESLKRDPSLSVGDFIPDIIIGDVHLYDLINESLFITIISTSCDSCLNALDALDLFANKHPDLNFLILVIGNEDAASFIREEFSDRARVYQMPIERVINDLKTNGFPWSYGVNGEGKILSSFPCASEEWFDNLVSPFVGSEKG